MKVANSRKFQAFGATSRETVRATRVAPDTAESCGAEGLDGLSDLPRVRHGCVIRNGGVGITTAVLHVTPDPKGLGR